MRAKGFQSTHPVRGATSCGWASFLVHVNFNPRTPCGVRLSLMVLLLSLKYFNPRTPCGVRPPAHTGPT